MNGSDKGKQYIALFGGFLGAVLLFLQSIDVHWYWFNENSIDAFTNVLIAAIPFVLVAYGVYKNTYVLTQKAKRQEDELKKKGLK